MNQICSMEDCTEVCAGKDCICGKCLDGFSNMVITALDSTSEMK